ncbi:ABC transporter permease [Rhodocytophaga rosea]|uniref:Cell division protein FtsX n=1 Tax=Rhodocytophaga rosea TaxID=2704465 RepID=A0A6C0GQ45_9BACT|nr:permease-like cell division protein FtsX [Rhodocytophaga rosea]QHT70186.1 ABC transporter permease [Rhodocytophaga rosea]
MQQEIKYKRKKRLGSYPYFTVVFSLTLALFVIGLGGLLILQASKLSNIVKENIEIQIYLDKYLTPTEISQVEKALSKRAYLDYKENQPQIRFISKDTAAQKFIKETGENFQTLLGENPLRDAYLIKIKPDYYQSQKMKIIKTDIEKIPGVFEATYVENLVDEINKNILRITFVLLVFAGILMFTITIMINNTIKLALFSQRFLIRSMQLVGATAGFIQKPFLLRSALQGFISGLMASVLLLVLMNYANTQIEELVLLQDKEKIAVFLLMLCILGPLISLVSSYRSVKKYLQLSLDELY